MSVPLTSWRIREPVSLLVLTLVCLCLASPRARAQSALHSAPITRVAVDPSQRPDPGTPTPPVGEFWTGCIVPGRGLLPNGEFPHVRGKFLYIDKAGTAVLAPPFDSVLGFSEGLARVGLDGKYGYIDRSGRLAIPVQFAEARDFSEGRAAVRSGELVGYIDVTGKIAIPARYSAAGDFSGGLARVVENGRHHFGYINVLGQTVIAPRFQEADDFRDGVAAVSLNGKWGSIDVRGEWVAAPQSGSPPPPPPAADAHFDGPRPFFEGGLWGYVDEMAQVVIPPHFHEAFRFSEGVAPVCVSADRLAAIPFAVRPLATATPPATRADFVPVPRPGPPRLSDEDQRRLAELHDKVVLLSRERQYHEAIGPAQDALDTVELRLSRDDPALIRPLWDLGRVHHALANYRAFIAVGAVPRSSLWREARDHFQRALELTEHSQGAHHPDAGELASELGDLLASQRDFDRAIDMKQRALAIARRTSGDRSVKALKAANDLEIVRIEKLVTPEFGRRLNTALPMALAQIRQAEATLGPDHPNVARGLSNLAAIYGSSKVGVRSASIAMYEQALALYANIGDDRQQSLKARAAVARLYVEARQYAAAERAFELLESSTNLTAVLGADDPAVTDLWRERAYSLEASGRYEAAAGLFARVVLFWENRLRDESPGATTELRSALESLADTRRFTREYAAAEGIYRRILDSEDELRLALPWPVRARLLRKLGTAQRLRGDMSSARKSFEGVLDLLKPHLPSSPTTWSIANFMTEDSLRELIGLAISSNDLNTARDYLRRAAALDDRVFWLFSDDRSVVDPERDRARSRFYHQMLTATGRHLRGDPEWVSRAYDLVLDRKGIAVDLQLQAKSATAVPERTQRQLEELADTRNALARAMIRRPESITSAQYAETVTRLFEREVTLEEEVSGDARLDLMLNLVHRRRRVTTADVVAGLPADTAVIEFVRVRDEDPASLDTNRLPDENATYLAFVLTPGGISLVELGSASVIDVLARNLQAAMRVDATAALTTGLLRELYDRVWLPLEPLLGGQPQVVVSPDGELHRVPFPALMEPAGGFLIERFRFAYSTSGRDLARSERTRAKPVLDLALIADPDFGPGGRFPSLPGTAIEAEQIPPLIPRDKARRILRAKAATETAFKRLPPARILHVATHGFFLDSAFDREAAWFEHALIRSGLVLAGANDSDRTDGGDDGILTALEVSGLDLSATELIVLASCDSGAGSIAYGQGVLGLRRGLRMAGVQSVLMALWPVDDELTAQMMVDFYRHRTTLPPATALWRAQIDAIGRMRAQHGFAAPQRWAAFILESSTAFGPSAASK